MNSNIFTTIVIYLINLRLNNCIKYNNYSLYNFIPRDILHLKFLQNLDTQQYIDIQFWKRPYKLHEEVQFIINPADKHIFEERAKHFNMKVEMTIADLQKAFNEQVFGNYLRLRTDTFAWNVFHNLEDINQWLADLALMFPTFVELFSIGTSHEGKSIYVIHIKRPGSKEKVIVEAGIHGNELLSTKFVTYLVHQLVYASESKNSNLIYVSKKYQWYIIPILNPDGYDYSISEDRLWRKNRRSISGDIGVDLNRNFDYNFCKHGASINPRDQYYCGPAPFSEPESKAFAEFITSQSRNLKFYFSFHTYGQRIIIPYGDRVQHVENYREMENYGKQAILKIYQMSGAKYRVGTVYDTLGLRISGNTASWVKKNFKVRYVFTFLLRDNGSYGFAIPNNQIQPTCEETLTGLLELMTARPKRVQPDMFMTSGSCRFVESMVFCSIVFGVILNEL